MTDKEIAEFFQRKPEIIFSTTAIQLASEVSTDMVIPISSSINEQHIPGLLLSCTPDTFNFFDIKEKAPEPNLKFRMVNLEERIYGIEIHLYLSEPSILKKRKTISLQLDPNNEFTKYFLELGLRKRLISFHIYNQVTQDLVTSITTLNEEELEWLERNLRLSKQIKSKQDYNMLSNLIREQHKKKRSVRPFRFYPLINKKAFFEFADNHFKMD